MEFDTDTITNTKKLSTGTSREVKEGKKYNGMTWKWASDKVTKCFNYARSLGYTKETFFITDNTDWDDVRTTMVPPHYGISCTWCLSVFEREAREFQLFSHFHVSITSQEYHSHCSLMLQRNLSKSNARMQTRL